MAEQLLKIATLFRVTAAELRRLARGPIHTERDTIVAVEAYLHRNQVRTADAFPPTNALKPRIFWRSSLTNCKRLADLRDTRPESLGAERTGASYARRRLAVTSRGQ